MDEENKEIVEIEKKEDAKVKRKKENVGFTIFISILILMILSVLCVSAVMLSKSQKKKKALSSLPLSEYAKHALQYKEIDFSKILIYGTDSVQPEKDCMILYFLKGTATIRFTGLENIRIDYEHTDYVKNDLRLIYEIPKGSPDLPVDVEITFDNDKCRLIENINAKPKLGNKIFLGAVEKIAGAIGGPGSYLFSSNFYNRTSLIKENNAETVVDLFEEAKPIIKAQLLYDDYSSSDKKDAKTESEYIQQKIADILASVITSDSDEWKTVSVEFVNEV